MTAVDDFREFDRYRRGEQHVYDVSGHQNHPEPLCAEHARQVLDQHHHKTMLGLSTGLSDPQSESPDPQVSKPHLGQCRGCARQLAVGNRQLRPPGLDDHAPGRASPYTTKAPGSFSRAPQRTVEPFRALPPSLNALDEDDEIAETGHLTPEHYKKMTFTDYPGRDISYVHQALTHREPHYMHALTEDVRRNGIKHPIEIAHHDEDAWEVGGGHHRAVVAWHLGQTAPYVRTQEPGDWEPPEHYHSENTKWRERRKEHPEEQQAYMRRGEADDPLKGKWADKHGVPGGEVFNCACGMPVEYDSIDGWQHTDGSISHDGELYGKSVSDLMGDIRARSARFTPEKRIFTHTCGLDHRLFDENGKLRPDVRGYIVSMLTAFWMLRYRNWRKWAKVYFAGSEASEWTSDSLEGNNDFDVLIGVDYDAFRTEHGPISSRAKLTDQQITDRMNDEFRSGMNPLTKAIMIDVNGTPTGPWDNTWYVNPDSYDIRKIKPYAAYDVTGDTWVVKPPHLPHWSLSDFPKPVVRTLRAADDYTRAVLKLPEPERTQQGAALFEAWHEDRSRAFSERGEGWYDVANLREKWLDQHGLWAELVDCAHRAKEGLDAAPADWSNTPPGYVAVVRPGSLPDRQQDAFDDPDFDAHRRKILDVAKQPGPGTRIWRGELRSAVEHPHEMTSVGMHWSTNPDAIVNPVAHSGGEHRAVVFQAVLDHPEEQSIPRGHPMWSGRHGYSMDHEAEVRTPPGAKVRLEGAYVHNGHPNPGPIVPAHPERTGPGWDWHPLDHHATVEPKGKIQYHAALPKTQKCKYCSQQATKRVIHSEGMAYIPVCDKHLAKGKSDAADCTPDGSYDPSNINAIRPIAAYADYVRDAWNRKAEQPEWDEKTKAQFRENGEQDYRYHSGATKHHQGEDWPGVGWVKTDKIAQYRDREPDKPEHWLGGKGGSSERIVNSLREGFRNGEGWEHPIQLHYHPGSNTTWMGEGNHRLRAAELEGHTHVPVTVRLDRHRPSQGKPFEGERKHDFELPEEDNGRIHPKHLLPSHWLSSEESKTASAATPAQWITPQLFIGPMPRGLNHARQVGSPEEALAAIKEGFTAVLPHGTEMGLWRILSELGMSRLEITQHLNLLASAPGA